MRITTELVTHAPDVETLFADLLWGTEGGLRYRARPPRFEDYPAGARWVVAHDGDMPVGVAALVPMAVGGCDLGSNFVVAPRMQGEGVGHLLAKRLAEEITGPTLVTVESDNVRSMLCVLGAGGIRLGTLEARVFTRTRPRRWSAAGPGELPAHLTDLDGHVSWQQVWRGPDCGMITVAHHWEVTSIGGRFGGMVLPLLRVFGIDARNFVFLSTHAAWGTPEAVERLIEHAMAETGAQATTLTSKPGTDEHAVYSQLALGAAGTAIGLSSWEVLGTEGAQWSLFEPLCVV